MSIRTRTYRCCAGHTLLELVLSLSLLGIIAASVGSAVLFASQATPAEDGPVATLTADSQALARIAEDLSLAKHLLEQSDHAVTVVVADRTGDGVPDRIRYAWSGISGEPLTHQLNDQEASAVIDSVQVFSLNYTSQTRSATLLGAYAPDGINSTISQVVSYTSFEGYDLEADHVLGQVFTPTLDPDAVAFVPTGLLFSATSAGTNDGQVAIGIYATDGNGPTGDDYSEAIASESDFYALFPEYLAFSDDDWADARDKIITLTSGSGTDANGTFYRHGTDGAANRYSTDGGATWNADTTGALIHTLYGQQVRPTLGWDISHAAVESIQVSLQSVAEDRSPLSQRVKLMLSPPKHDAFAQADFLADPTVLDLDADGVAEWSTPTGVFDSASITNGVWVSDRPLVYKPAGLSSASAITVRARARATGTLGPAIYGPYTVSTKTNRLMPVSTVLRSDGAGGQELAVYNDTSMTKTLVVVTGLPAGFVDVRLTVIPDEAYLYIEVNHRVVGGFELDSVVNPGTLDEAVWFGSAGGYAEFDSISVHLGGAYTLSKETELGSIDAGFTLEFTP